MAIITISRQEGSLSREIAATIAEKHKWFYMDKAIIEKSLVGYGIEPENFKRYDEKKPSLWDNFSLEYDRYYNFFKLYLLEKAYENKGCVLLGRGGAFFLKDIPGVLRIRLIASEETRIERIMERFKCDEKYAKKIMHQTDHDRNGFHKFFYNESWEDPSLYDIFFNTDKISTDTIFSMIDGAIHTFVKEKYDKTGKLSIGDLLISQRIINRILYSDKIPVHLLEVEVKDGNVTLIGSVEIESLIDQCEETALKESGVNSITNNIVFINQYPPIM
jgi:cytidylate kinase